MYRSSHHSLLQRLQANNYTQRTWYVFVTDVMIQISCIIMGTRLLVDCPSFCSCSPFSGDDELGIGWDWMPVTNRADALLWLWSHDLLFPISKDWRLMWVYRTPNRRVRSSSLMSSIGTTFGFDWAFPSRASSNAVVDNAASFFFLSALFRIEFIQPLHYRDRRAVCMNSLLHSHIYYLNVHKYLTNLTYHYSAYSTFFLPT